MEIGELLTLAEQIKALGQPKRAVDLYKIWIAFHPDHPLLHAVSFNHAVCLSEIGDTAGAINALRETIRIKPDFYPPYINLGNQLEASGRGDAAIEAWKKVVEDLPSITADSVSYKTMALNQIGRVFEGANSDAAAEESLRQSLSINPDQPEAVQHWIALRQRQCKWPVFGDLTQIKPTKLLGNISPLSLACYADDPLFQLANAYRYNKTAIGRPQSYRTTRQHPVPAHRPEKLKIGYISSDFREHAVGFSMTEVVELHDRTQTEIFTYYCGSVKGTDATQARTKAGTDHWCDISGMDDAQAARKIHADGIHILIDLNGYTKDARTKVFAMRPAPINVNWFGFPGTMGSPYHHYIVADQTIIPPELEAFYSEKVLHLPCYQLLPQRNAETDGNHLPALDGNPSPGARQRAVAADRNRRYQRAPAAAGGCPWHRARAAGLCGQEAEPGPSRALCSGRCLPRQHAVWRAYDRRRQPVDGRAGRHLARTQLRCPRLRQPRDCGRHSGDDLHGWR